MVWTSELISNLSIIAIAGVLVGFINTMAGGGSIISLSLLMFFGLEANIANGTNRVAIIFQGLSSLSVFRKNKMLDLQMGGWYFLPAIIGAIIGAFVATDLDKEVIRKAIGIVMLLMVIFIVKDPGSWLKDRPELRQKRSPWLMGLVFFMIGLYGGFVQVGVGYLLLAALVLGAGYDLVKANAIKILITFVYTPFAFAIFIWNHQVDWYYGLALALGTFAGGWIAARMAVKKGAGFVRWVLIIIIVITFLESFDLIDFKNIIELF